MDAKEEGSQICDDGDDDDDPENRYLDQQSVKRC